MSSFSPVLRVRKLLDKMKSERNSPRLKRFPSRTLSEEAQDYSSYSSEFHIPPFKSRKEEYTGENQFNTLPVEATLYILTFLNSRDLCHMSQASKEMGILANDEIVWRDLTMYDWGINEAFTDSWKSTYAHMEELCSDGVWEGMSKWLEPAGYDNEQKTTARLHFVKRSASLARPSSPARSSPMMIHRVDSQSACAPIVRSTSAFAPIVKSTSANVTTPQNAPHKIIGSGVTINLDQPSPFKIEGLRTILDPTGRTFEWNKQFEKHTSVYSGKMDFATNSVEGIITYSEGGVNWKGVFSYTKMNRRRGSKLVMA